MLRFFRKKKPDLIVLALNARLQPMHRAELEDAFDEVAETLGLGARVTGGGTLMAPDGEIERCDIDIELDDYSRELAEKVAAVVGEMLAPKGSEVILPDDEGSIPFGSDEGLGLYLNGTDLPAEVYASCDSNHVHDECERLLGEEGMIHSYWQGPTETAFYMYGRSYEEMLARISGFLAEYPLCQKCRVVRLA
ncbi:MULTISPECIES: hypothetical protein [Myxococcus]|uniref:hypothetical protein n=1 Tax=Myxococcus TaxID=32 RepID=UPI001142D3FC|nr:MULTISPECIES: hypothetical protein [Myxococcus]NOK01873.1 hypothetical protein [Myxococcus xanthus]